MCHFGRVFAVVCLFLSYPSLNAQTAINPIPVGGSTRITITTGTAPAGSTIAIFKTTEKGKCGAAATPVPLVTGLDNTIVTGGTTPLEVKGSFTLGDIVCAVITESGGKVDPPSPEVVIPAAPSTTTSISPVPSAGDDTLTLTLGTVAAGATIKVFSPASGAPCVGTATSLPLARTAVAQLDPTAVMLRDKLTQAELVCAIFNDTTPTGIVTVGPAVTAIGPAKYTFPLPEGAPASVGSQLNLIITAADSSGKTLEDFNGDVLVQTTDSGATLKSDTVTLTKGTGIAVITFITPGKQTVIVSGNGAKGTLDLVVDTSVAGCSSCFASIGAGAAVFSPNYSDYEVDAQNIVQKTHLGNSTPQYLVGLSYKLSWHTLWGIKLGHESLYTRLGCTVSDFAADSSDAHAAYCYPFKAFISLKFSPDASQTFSGFTYGISHSLHKRLDVLLGLSYTPYSEISEGFQAAAINTLKTQASNPCYAQFSVTDLSSPDGRNKYDGFPTQLLTNTGTPSAPVCTAGGQIYSGSVLVTHHHSGAFIGISVPISFKTFLGGK